jgi:hypothetical protein
MTMTAQSEQATTSQAPATVMYHWIMTIQSGNGRIATSDGSVNVTPGTHTRTQTYDLLLKDVRERFNLPDAVVLFFDLAVDQL